MVLVKNLKFCLRFVLFKIHREKVFGEVFVRKQAFLNNINMDLKRSQNWHFCKGDSPFFFCILFIYFLFTGIVQTTYRSKHTNATKFTTTTLITKNRKRKKNKEIKSYAALHYKAYITYST